MTLAAQSEAVVAVDVGGTFTDVCVLGRPSGNVRVAEVPSTADPIDGVLAGFCDARDRSRTHHPVVSRNDGGDKRTDHAPAAPFGDGSTSGFRDVIEIRRGN